MYIGNYPKIYGLNSTDYSSNGYGFLQDGQSCEVKEKLNGGLEFELVYPITGKGFSYLAVNATILSPVNPYDNWQPFRIYSITRAQNGFVRVNAEHKSYELSGYPCLPNDDYIETEGSCAQLMAYLQSEVSRTATAIGNPAYTFTTDIVKNANWSITAPTDIKSVMALAVQWYGGEWKYDGTECKLCAKRGEDRHVKVQYGSNLSEMTQGEVDTSYTHILPYWTDGTTIVYINGYITIASHTEGRMQKHVLILDMSDEFDAEPTQQELYDAAVAWELKDENKPKGLEKTLKVKFVPRGQTMEYASLGDIDHVELGDEIDCSDSPLGVSGTQRCIALTYDVYRGRYKLAELGKPAENIATAEVKQTKGQRDKTVWVSPTEPTEGYISGDYWIKIDNTVDRNAQGLGRYTGGQWLMLCNYGSGGGGVGEDIGNNSERFNDYNHNTATGSHSYLHIEGSYNTASGGYCVSIGGYGNSLTNGYYSNIHGSSNACAYAYGSTICGVQNIITNASRCGVWGYNNTIKGSNSLICGENNTLTNRTGSSNGADSCIVGGENNTVTYDGNLVVGGQNTISSVYNIVGGEFNTVSDRLNIVSGNTNTVAGSRCLVAGQGNNVGYGAQDSVIVGEYNTSGTGNAYCALIAGMYANIGSGDRIVIGNGNNNSPANAFRVNQYGKVYASEYNTSGADYAIYFEWLDGNLENEDRRGMLVSLCADKIVPAHGDEIYGIVSANPAVRENAYEEEWHGKYKRDVFGAYILDNAGDKIISEDYDYTKQYIPRSQRSEWAPIARVGRLIIRDNGKCMPNGYVSARNGVGVPTLQTTNIRVLRRVDDNHIEVTI